jgi:hypothetical protein
MEAVLKKHKAPLAILQKTDLDEIAGAIETVVMPLILLTPRVNKPLLGSAAANAWDLDKPIAQLWAERVVSCLQHVRSKGSKSTTGKRTPEVVLRMYKAMVGAEEATPQVQESPAEESAAPKRRRILQKTMSVGSSSAPPSPKMQISASSSSRDAIMAIYAGGVQAPPKNFGVTLKATTQTPIELIDSQEEASPPRAVEQQKQYLDSEKACVVRIAKDGSTILAKMMEGPNGFALAEFPGEVRFETEMPNLILVAKNRKPAPLAVPHFGWILK